MDNLISAKAHYQFEHWLKNDVVRPVGKYPVKKSVFAPLVLAAREGVSGIKCAYTDTYTDVSVPGNQARLTVIPFPSAEKAREHLITHLSEAPVFALRPNCDLERVVSPDSASPDVFFKSTDSAVAYAVFIKAHVFAVIECCGEAATHIDEYAQRISADITARYADE